MAVNEKPAKPATSPRVRVFTSVDDFERTLREVEEETASKYITYKKQYDFGEKNVQPSAERTTKWELKNVKFDFIPFQLIGTKVYECHLGKDRNVQKKDKYHATKQRQALEDHAFMARQRRVQDTKKMGCPAQFAVSHVMKFPDFKIAKDTTHNRNKASAALKAALANSPSAVEGIVELHTSFPTIDDHQNHATVGHVAELREPVDPRVIEQVERLTLAGARKVSEIKRHLHTFVNDELFRGQPPPSTTRRRYFPTDRDIWNVMTRLKDTTRNAQQDQANLQVLCTRWSSQGDCNIKFGQAIVGVFISHSEKTEDIAEALQVFKEWNADWHPSHFMVDFCEAEIGALEAEFPESEVLLCDFHREKAWVEWVRKRENGVSHAQETLLKLLRDVAAAATTEDYDEAISRLHESQLWGENERLRSWLNNKWLRATCIKRWVHAFKDENLRVAIYTNNGVERQNETLKYSHLDGSKKRSLCEMLTVVVTDFLPTAYRKYVQLNVAFSSCYRKYHSNIPTYLQDRPRGVVNHILPRLTEAQCYEPGNIITVGPGVFKVTSKGGISQHYHTVNFETSSANNMPSCTCRDWAKHKMPCKHFCAIFTLEEGWTWDKLSPAYRDNPLFSLDDTFLASSSSSSSSCDDDSWMEDTTPKAELDLPALSPSPPVYSDLPVKRKSRLNKLRRECASLLHEMTNVTYNLQDEVFLIAVKDELTTMYEEMLGRAPHDNTIPLRSPKKRKREAADHDNLHSLPSLPPKHPASHRVGRNAEMLRAGLRANISVDTKEEAPELETIVVDCELEDREALQKGQWLTDKHMNAAQHLIKSEYPLIDGLRDTVVLMANQSGPVRATSDSLQVHNIKDHWVLSSSTGGSITVYDSLQPSMKPELRSQLVHLYKQFAEGEDQIISVNVVCAQRQQGGNDCGLYAIANAAALAEDIHPTQVVFDQSQMRRHLEECLENNGIKMFPHSQAEPGNGVPSRTYELSTYCSCYEHRPGAPMIMCDKCAQWFHYPCVNLSESAVHLLITQRQEYLCPKCVTA
ncbi:hypothetical protein Bbelb_069090 [Branchiostoma belcheri]|nr:hypothetical protein Bbelb_069090 [Branchiostoma belcheri]